MQTFLPYKEFDLVAQCLDDKRLGKQRVECKQLLDVIEGRKDNSWKNHPAARMWWNFSSCLRLYYNFMIIEWVNRGFKNTMPILDIGDVVYPDWFLNEKELQLVMISQRSNLIDKLPDHYSKFGWKSYNIKGYYWAVPPRTKQAQKINQLWLSVV